RPGARADPRPARSPVAQRGPLVPRGGADRREHRAGGAPRAGGRARPAWPRAHRARAAHRDAPQRLRIGRRAVSETRDPIEGLVESLLKELGEDPSRDGLVRTPGRVARALRFLTSGYEQDPIAILNNAVFEESYDEMV